MNATVFRNANTGKLALFGPDQLYRIPSEILTGTLTGSVACGSACYGNGFGQFFKVSGSLAMTFTMTRLSGQLAWVNSALAIPAGLTITPYTNNTCTTPAGVSLVLQPKLLLNCFTQNWDFYLTGFVPGGGSYIFSLWSVSSQAACSVVGNTLSIANASPTCTASGGGGMLTGGTVSIPLCS